MCWIKIKTVYIHKPKCFRIFIYRVKSKEWFWNLGIFNVSQTWEDDMYIVNNTFLQEIRTLVGMNMNTGNAPLQSWYRMDFSNVSLLIFTSPTLFYFKYKKAKIAGTYPKLMFLVRHCNDSFHCVSSFTKSEHRRDRIVFPLVVIKVCKSLIQCEGASNLAPHVLLSSMVAQSTIPQLVDSIGCHNTKLDPTCENAM